METEILFLNLYPKPGPKLFTNPYLGLAKSFNPNPAEYCTWKYGNALLSFKASAGCAIKEEWVKKPINKMEYCVFKKHINAIENKIWTNEQKKDKTK